MPQNPGQGNASPSTIGKLVLAALALVADQRVRRFAGEAERDEGEAFADFYRRVGKAPFKAAVYEEAAHVAA